MACIITDGKLQRQIEGPEIVINHPESVLEAMNDWCIDQHTRSGLSDAVRASTTSLQQAEDQVIEFIQWHIQEGYKPVIAGNSVHVDVSFLKRHMPKLAELFHYRIVDVSSVGELCRRWFPAEFARQPKKDNCHTAMQDVRESIQQLKFYQQHVFIHPSQQRKKTSSSSSNKK
jgi:oligoribonuclease